MSGELEAAGALATAGVVAGAIEGREGGPPGEGACANCGAELTGPFCAQCGQHAYPRRKLIHVVGELMHGLFYLETKTWRTLPMVMFRPGTLTRNYVFGKRARYLSPLTMFLFAIFLMFFAFSTIETPASIRDGSDVTQADLTDAHRELAEARAELERARTHPNPDEPEGLEVGLAEGAVGIAERQVERLERQLAEQEAAQRADDSQPDASTGATPQDAAQPPAAGAGQPPAAPARPASASTEGESDDPGADAGADEGANDDAHDGGNDGDGEVTTWQDEMREMARNDDLVVNSGSSTLNERIRRKFENPDLALYQVQDAASKFSFLLAPLSLPFIALLFLWKRGVTLYDHMAYALYALAFAAFLFSAVVLLGKIPWVGWASAWLLCALPAHMYFHLGGAYKLGWWSALWRTFFMLNFALVVAATFLALVVVLGLAG